MAETVSQPTARPTNKMLAFLIATIVTNAIIRGLDVGNDLTWLATDMQTLREAIFGVVSIGIGYGVAWLTKDRANAPPVSGQQSGV